MYEDKVLGLIKNGIVAIDDSGRLYRDNREIGYINGRSGYKDVEFIVDGKRRNMYVHRIVYAYFKGPLTQGLTINHINCDKTDNRPENLEQISISDNIKHAVKHDKYSRKLDRYKVKEIRELAKKGISQRKIAKQYSIAQPMVCNIVNNNTWKHI